MKSLIVKVTALKYTQFTRVSHTNELNNQLSLLGNIYDTDKPNLVSRKPKQQMLHGRLLKRQANE